MLLGLHGSMAAPRHRVGWLALFGAAWLLQALSNGYFMLFLPALLVPWLAWFVDWRRNPRASLSIVAAWAIASLPLLPILFNNHQVHEQMGLSRSVTAIRVFSARTRVLFPCRADVALLA